MPMLGWLHRYVTLTTTRGLKPTDVPDVYKVKIYVGSRPTMSKVDAAAVKETLVARYHIAPDRLSTNGYGASGPIDTNDTLGGRARNRRVELTRE